jgi:hypothetical protein
MVRDRGATDHSTHSKKMQCKNVPALGLECERVHVSVARCYMSALECVTMLHERSFVVHVSGIMPQNVSSYFS